MASPVLFFCIGATKAGTSWLHRYLSDHPDCHLRGVKELHYFDALAFDRWKPWIADVRAAETRARRRARDAEGAERARRLRLAEEAGEWARFLEAGKPDDAAYLAYLTQGLGERRLVADITPAYGLLPETWLRRMAGLTGNVRFIYLLRDPVARLWSHCRMIAKRRAGSPELIDEAADRVLNRVIAGKEDEIARRSDYAGVLTRMRAALTPGSWRLFFYEELFTNDTVAAICDFLGLRRHPADFGRRVMQGPKVALAPARYQAARAWLAPQYDYLRETLPRLPASWDAQAMKV